MFGTRMLAFVVRTVLASFRGDKLVQLLTISTVCVSLSLVGIVSLARQNFVAWADSWASNMAVAVFVDPDIDDATREKLHARLQQNAGLKDIVWTAPDAAAIELSRLVGASSHTGLQRFAPWIAEAVRTADTNDAVLDKLSDDPNVLFIDRGTVFAEKLRQVSQNIRVGGGVLSLLLLLGAFLVVSNTVGLALNARRDEVEIMALVGTPLEWIYTAYLTEGIILCMMGASLAVGLTQLAIAGLDDGWLQTLGIPAVMGYQQASALALICIGGIIGAAGSAISVKRFLKQA